MLIDRNHSLVQPLITEWQSSRGLSSEEKDTLSSGLQRRLAEALVSLIQSVAGELCLFYHQFLTMEPTGEHSFAHGSSMWSKDVFWVSVARLPKDVSLMKQESKGRTIEMGAPGEGVFKIHIAGSTQFLIPVVWLRHLHPAYMGGSAQPSFIVEKWPETSVMGGWVRKRPKEPIVEPPSTGPLDISAMGHHLFDTRPGRLDWATNIFLALGTEVVRSWLAERGASETYAKLQVLETS